MKYPIQYLTLLVILLLGACGGEETPTPDRIATRVAEEQAVAATLTAAAALNQPPTAPPATATPVSQAATATANPTTPTSEPPTNAPPTAAPPTATPPLPVPVGLLIQAPGDKGDLQGDVFAPPELVSGSAETPIFTQGLTFNLFVYDPQAGQADGDGIAGVDFTILCPNGEEYTNHEESPAYCLFGGDVPCSFVRLRVDDNLPGSHCAIEAGFYDVTIRATPRDPQRAGGNWSFSFELQLPQTDSSPHDELYAEIVQTEPGSTSAVTQWALAFQVVAYDPAVGTADGAGISYVEFQIIGPDGSQVYAKRENTPGYCAFGGGEPDCAIFEFTGQGYHWPGGEPMQRGTHQLVATVVSDSGQTKTVTTSIEIQ